MATTTYRKVRALERGLEVLACLNRFGSASVTALAKETGMHRATVARLLATLNEKGYVATSSFGDVFHVTEASRSLSQGHRAASWVEGFGQRCLETLVSETVWPVELADLSADSMIIQGSTHHLSPMTHGRAILGARWPVMTTAIGRAYLSFCSDPQREVLLNVLRTSTHPANLAARDNDYVERIVKTTRLRGYAESYREAGELDSAIALPIQGPKGIVGCMNIICFASVMTPDRTAARYLPQMRATVSDIEGSIRSSRVH